MKWTRALHNRLNIIVPFALYFVCQQATVRAQTLTTLVSFNGTDGSQPTSQLAEGLDLVLACVSTVMIWLVWWVYFCSRRRTVYLPPYRFAVELLTVGLAALTGHLGGFLSGVNLPG
jgi:uncharacterized membrane protein